MRINNDPEQNKKKGETTNLHPSGYSSNTKDYLGKFNHISSENKNFVSEEQPIDRINGALSKFKRRQANLSSDQFLNLNNSK